ncbi:CinA family protein [Afifella sp. IM 167]|uniref:CinA family protein n=1 Tax=Afifella sp. IM 167 TaxID=2033586 RepID=UPI001CCC29F9|nr:nicotinamide-nucleotide amidohydrolase family protein [Afifella sp. IM 167]MBZ8132533.1 damage-inducible protein CinA [Afifella sp. IM 167]
MAPESSFQARAASLLDICRQRGLMIATAESCTGGGLAAVLTEIAGSSEVFERGFVTYSNAAKMELLGVPAEMIERHGAVSTEVARAMAEGALAHSHAGLSLSITGVAGPGGGTAAKPVGLVCFAAALRSGTVIDVEKRFDAALGRTGIRRESVATALDMLAGLARKAG